eukprot:scaffold1989_cov79-Isochrysis_galbana.AAC.1
MDSEIRLFAEDIEEGRDLWGRKWREGEGRAAGCDAPARGSKGGRKAAGQGWSRGREKVLARRSSAPARTPTANIAYAHTSLKPCRAHA